MATREARQEIDSDAVRREWLDRLVALVEEVKGWAQASGWRTRRIDKTVNERRLGSYKVPVLLTRRKDTVEVVAEPFARPFVPSTNGKRSTSMWRSRPTMTSQSLYLEGNHWFLHYSG